MTPEKALKYLKGIVGDGSMPYVICPIKTEVLVTAIKALKKNVPYVPKVYSNGYLEWEIKCPECGYELDEENFCPNCGQAIYRED